MLVHHPKTFFLGLAMTVGFFVTLAYMFTPSFGGMNAFEASDQLFNTISKGSTYYVDQVAEKNQAFKGQEVQLSLKLGNEKLAEQARVILTKVGMQTTPGQTLMASGDVGLLIEAVLADAKEMFYNNEAPLTERYDMDGRTAMFTWWSILHAADKSLKNQKAFKIAAHVNEVQTKSVEVSYNYFGIEPQSASSKAGILTFSLVFYVVYTLWWGYAIFFLSDGIGLQMKGGKRKEM